MGEAIGVMEGVALPGVNLGEVNGFERGDSLGVGVGGTSSIGDGKGVIAGERCGARAGDAGSAGSAGSGSSKLSKVSTCSKPCCLRPLCAPRSPPSVHGSPSDGVSNSSSNGDSGFGTSLSPGVAFCRSPLPR